MYGKVLVHILATSNTHFAIPFKMLAKIVNIAGKQFVDGNQLEIFEKLLN